MSRSISALKVIKPRSGWQAIDLKEIKEYRDLFFFLVWRDIKVLYAQTILGFSWAILQPVVQIVIFTIVFGKVAKVPTEGIPYVLFSSVAIIPWTYLSQAMTQSSQSLVQGQNMLGKIYFPRLRVFPTWNLLLFPLLVVLMALVALGVGMWLSAMAIRYRDIKDGMPFALRMLMYTAPVVYSASSIPEKYRMIYSLNPIVAVIEGFRSCLLGTPMPWRYILPGIVTAVILFISGALYFKRMERVFVDVI
jgi:lipopolysaccharide transport system permease protein